MSDTLGPAIHAAEATTRIPANLMSLLRQSYDSREKMLDWCVALAVAGVAVYVFRNELRGMIEASDPSANVGRPDAPIPNQATHTAFPAGGPIKANPALYTYNMPVSRAFKYGIAPSSVPPPSDPSQSPFPSGNDQE